MLSKIRFQRVHAVLLVGLLAWAVELSGHTAGAADAVPPKVDFKIDEVEVPFILWGGDVATFHANGGPITRGGTSSISRACA
jgi:hypothetical protein